MNPCHTCEHPNRLTIDELLRGKRSVRDIAKEFGINEKALGRHKRNHLAAKGERPAEARPPSAPSDRAHDAGLDPAAELRAQLQDLNAIPADDLSPTARIALFDARRRTAEALAKLDRPGTPSVVKVADVDGLPDLLRDMYLALRPFPEARAAMAAVWRSHGATIGAGADA